MQDDGRSIEFGDRSAGRRLGPIGGLGHFGRFTVQIRRSPRPVPPELARGAPAAAKVAKVGCEEEVKIAVSLCQI